MFPFSFCCSYSFSCVCGFLNVCSQCYPWFLLVFSCFSCLPLFYVVVSSGFPSTSSVSDASSSAVSFSSATASSATSAATSAVGCWFRSFSPYSVSCPFWVSGRRCFWLCSYSASGALVLFLILFCVVVSFLCISSVVSMMHTCV